MAKQPIEAHKSYHDGQVSIQVHLKCSGYGNSAARIDGSTELTVEQARSLAVALTTLADAAEAKVAAKAAAAARRKAWRDREVAAGRMKIMPW
jgi:hypothetical protein